MFSLDPEEHQCITIYPGLADKNRRSAFHILPSALELLYRWSQYEEGAALDEDGFSSMGLILFDFECLDVQRFSFI